MVRKRTKKEKADIRLVVKALIVIASLLALLECLAIVKGIDGQMFGLSAAGLGTIGGYLLKLGLGVIRRK